MKRGAEGQDPTTLLRLAAVMEDIGCGSDAVDLYRRYADQVKEPEAIFYLALPGTTQPDRRGARLCDRAWGKCPARLTAAASMDILQEGKAEAGKLDRLEGRLKESLDKDRGSVELVLFLGSLQETRRPLRRSGEAIPSGAGTRRQ